MANFIVGGIILVLVGAAIAYIRKEKKKGVRCIGCPAGGTCSGNCSGCHSDTKEKNRNINLRESAKNADSFLHPIRRFTKCVGVLLQIILKMDNK